MVTEEQVMEALKECYDPEMGISIVDLGLIYDAKTDGSNVHIKMTLTTPGCPMHSMIVQEARAKVEEVPGVKNVEIEMVWDPPWTPERLSPEAKQKLGLE
jgi:metal-sulfur cluster biosynthetic enzyme